MSDIDDCLKSVERLTRDRDEVMRAGNDKIAEIRARHNAVLREKVHKARRHEAGRQDEMDGNGLVRRRDESRLRLRTGVYMIAIMRALGYLMLLALFVAGIYR